MINAACRFFNMGPYQNYRKASGGYDDEQPTKRHFQKIESRNCPWLPGNIWQPRHEYRELETFSEGRTTGTDVVLYTHDITDHYGLSKRQIKEIKDNMRLSKMLIGLFCIAVLIIALPFMMRSAHVSL